MTTKLPAIPQFTGNNADQVIAALTEATQVRTGVRGDPLDAGVTFRDLTEIGFVQESTGETIQNLSSKVFIKLPAGEISPLYDGSSDLTTPPSPTELTATAIFETVILTWNVARFANPSYYEVYRSFVNDLSTAQLAGTSTAQSFTDVIGENRTLYYWVRTVSQAGVKSAWNSSNGTEVKTGIEPSKLIEILEGQILLSSLSQELASSLLDSADQVRVATSRITKEIQQRIAAIQAEASARAAAILAEATARGTAISNEATLRTNADNALAQQITNLSATAQSTYATIAALQAEQTARADGDTAQATARETLATQLRGTYTGGDIGQLSSGLLYSERQARSTADSALSSRSDALEATVNNATTGLVATRASLINDYFTKVDTNSAIASATTNLVSTTTLTNTLGSYQTTAAAQQNFFAKADGQSLQGQYTVKIDLNGHVSGFGLASTVVNGTPSSAFIVRADKFAIVDPASTANNLTNSPSADTVPFAYTSGDANVPAGVYIKQAFIKNADITDAKIGSVSAKKITAGYINASIAINGAQVYGTSLYSGGTTTVNTDANGNVTSFVANNPTVAISGGTAEFLVSSFKIKHLASSSTTTTPFEVVDDVVRIKTAAIGDGTIGMAKIEDTIQSTNYANSSTGWQLTKAGAFNLKNGTITAGLIRSSDNKMQIDLTNGFIRIEA